MEILDGKKVSFNLKEKLKPLIAEELRIRKRPPHLAAILVGNNGASETYVANKIRSCEEVGIKSSMIRFPTEVDEINLITTIKNLNEDPEIDGILVQLPLPPQINESRIIQVISPLKDVDGFHPVNAGNLMLGKSSFVPATPLGIMYLLEHYNIETAGKHAVIIGRSNIVGRPLSVLLSQNTNPGNCTVTLCHSKTKNLKDLCLTGDIIVAALGKPGFLKCDMVKAGAVVIDVGITRTEDVTKKSGYAIKGDVDFDNVAPLCSYITPVPGGVGVMTISALLMNTFKAYTSNLN